MEVQFVGPNEVGVGGMVVIVVVIVIVGFVAEEAFALGEPGDTEGDEREGLAPEKPGAGMVTLDRGPDRQTGYHSHADDEGEAADYIDSISIALAARECSLRRGLAEEKDADVAE